MSQIKINPIPNIVTGMNLLSGCMAISMAIQDNYEAAAYFIFLSAIFDFLDGFLAKILNAESEFGRIFDSIVDVVSFGVAPSMLMYKLMVMSLTFNDSTFNLESADRVENFFLLSSFLITLFAAIRLARFTSSTKEAESFRGMPTPATAILVASLIVVATSEISDLQYFIFNNTRLLIFIFAICLLMVVNLPMMKLKFHNARIRENFMKYLFILGAIVLFVTFQIAGIPLIVLLYLVLSIVNTLIKEPV